MHGGQYTNFIVQQKCDVHEISFHGRLCINAAQKSRTPTCLSRVRISRKNTPSQEKPPRDFAQGQPIPRANQVVTEVAGNQAPRRYVASKSSFPPVGHQTSDPTPKAYEWNSLHQGFLRLADARRVLHID